VWLDVGAHIGSFAFYAVLRGASKVICVEADDDNYRLLCKNIADNKLQKVIIPIHAAAVPPSMARKKAIDLHLSPDKTNTYRASVMDRPRARQLGRVIQVVPITLAKLCRAHPDIDAMKVDIEGAEVPLLLESAIPRKIRKIVFEYTMNSRAILDIESRLAKQGLSFVNLPKHMRKLVPGHIDTVVFATRSNLQ
jgi:FkbM family methyltransferase